MCLAFPGKIVRISGSDATIDYGAEKRTAKLIEPKYKKGDYVLVQGKVVVEKVKKEDAQRWLDMITGNG